MRWTEKGSRRTSDLSETSQVSGGLLKLLRVESVDQVQHNRAVVSDYPQFDVFK